MATLFEVISADQESRFEAINNVTVYELTGPSTQLLPPGSGVIVVSDSDSSLFDKLNDSLSHKDISAINEIVDLIKKQVSSLKKLSSTDASKALLTSKSFGNLSYNSKNIAINLFTTPKVGFTRTFFPFTGGTVDKEKFRFISYNKRSDDKPLKALVVLHQPNLSELEKSALSRLPPQFEAMKFGTVGAERMCTPAALVATVTVGLLVAAVGTALGNCTDLFDKSNREIINPAIDGTNAALSLQNMLDIRREMLTQKG